LRVSACAQTAPNIPVEAPITAAGVPVSALSPAGREAQSSAFFSTPGIEWLYSGVAIRTASASRIASRSASTASGAGAPPSSRSAS
jgi:hypothetical protein